MMTVCKKMTERRIKRVGFYRKQRNMFIFKHLTLKKSLRRFITEHIPDVRIIISYINPLAYYDCCRR